MADKKSVGHAYNVDFLNVVFAASSLFLFLSVIWMVWDDFDRDWKKTQRRFTQLELQVTQAQLQQAGFYFRAAHEQIPGKPAAIVFYHYNNGALVDGQRRAGKPGIF